MGLISVETAIRIWNCYQEIKNGKKLIEDMEVAMKLGEDPNPRDPFGRRQPLQLGVPCGDNAHTLFDVQPKLAMSVIRAHIANKERELAEANEQARIELETA